jgi:hypothetical protein
VQNHDAPSPASAAFGASFCRVSTVPNCCTSNCPYQSRVAGHYAARGKLSPMVLSLLACSLLYTYILASRCSEVPRRRSVMRSRTEIWGPAAKVLLLTVVVWLVYPRIPRVWCLPVTFVLPQAQPSVAPAGHVSALHALLTKVRSVAGSH